MKGQYLHCNITMHLSPLFVSAVLHGILILMVKIINPKDLTQIVHILLPGTENMVLS